MVTLHTPCNKFLEVTAKWLEKKSPVFFVDERRRDTCPVCGDPLTFATLHAPRSLDNLTPEEQDAWFESLGESPTETRSLVLGF